MKWLRTWPTRASSAERSRLLEVRTGFEPARPDPSQPFGGVTFFSGTVHK